ncbi:MAG: hypothetical protein H6981_07245 [Gammaproteobacteria bacterium]|nr:hypothetical protein [Gammaproteobacteria bacterium]
MSEPITRAELKAELEPIHAELRGMRDQLSQVVEHRAEIGHLKLRVESAHSRISAGEVRIRDLERADAVNTRAVTSWERLFWALVIAALLAVLGLK